MYARVVRFTDVDPDHLAERLAEAEGSEVRAGRGSQCHGTTRSRS